MSKSMVEQIERAAVHLGFHQIGYDGRNHVVWEHRTGRRVTSPCTPSEWRGVRNAIAQLERIAGERLPRPNHRRSRRSFADEPDPQVEAQRRRSRARVAERDAVAAADRRRREIEELMMP